ncbi:MAG TPA: alpha/beta fold hydrolase [Acidimicrobiales bacterium]
MDTVRRPRLPTGRTADLDDRGALFYREVHGPPGAPTLVLLHGWTITADLNFHPFYEQLGRHFRVLAPDQRGHGRGIRSQARFALEDCADDVAALCRQLGIDRAIVCGYSMGGTIAQLAWRRHPVLVEGLVLSATASRFTESRRDRAMFAALGGLSYMGRRLPEHLKQRIGLGLLHRHDDSVDPWVLEELARHDWARVGEAGIAIGQFDSSSWIGTIDVPTSAIVTLHDDVVDPMRQLRMSRTIPGCDLTIIEGEHAVCATDPVRFGEILEGACRDVARRAHGRTAHRTHAISSRSRFEMPRRSLRERILHGPRAALSRRWGRFDTDAAAAADATSAAGPHRVDASEVAAAPAATGGSFNVWRVAPGPPERADQPTDSLTATSANYEADDAASA